MSSIFPSFNTSVGHLTSPDSPSGTLFPKSSLALTLSQRCSSLSPAPGLLDLVSGKLGFSSLWSATATSSKAGWNTELPGISLLLSSSSFVAIRLGAVVSEIYNCLIQFFLTFTTNLI